MPVLDVGCASLEGRLVRGPGHSLSFSLQTQQRTFDLIPYHRVAHERYSLYWRYRPTDHPSST